MTKYLNSVQIFIPSFPQTKLKSLMIYMYSSKVFIQFRNLSFRSDGSQFNCCTKFWLWKIINNVTIRMLLHLLVLPSLFYSWQTKRTLIAYAYIVYCLLYLNVWMRCNVLVSRGLWTSQRIRNVEVSKILNKCVIK